MTEKNNESVETEVEFSDIDELNKLGNILTNVVNESKLDSANVSTLLLGIALGYARTCKMLKADFLKYASDIWDFTEEVTKEDKDEKTVDGATVDKPVEEKSDATEEVSDSAENKEAGEPVKEETAEKTN